MRASESQTLSLPRRAIARAAIAVVGERGVEGLTHRAVAEAAEISLGSTTYHFATLEDILQAAMQEAMLVSEIETRAWAGALGSEAGLANALAERLERTTGPERSRMVVEYELYLAAVRHPSLRVLSVAWGQVLPDALCELTDAVTARALSTIEYGLQLESLISGAALLARETRPIFERALDASR